jgi:hypothetical protein
MFLTEKMFKDLVNFYTKKYPLDSHWNLNRWAYHKITVEILKKYKAKKILELGTMGIKVHSNSDEMDFNVGWRIEKPKYMHDARITPWPITDKKYDFLVALRVFHHLTPFQSNCFQEARRIARNIIIVEKQVLGLKEF